jgi:hypothetical protein
MPKSIESDAECHTDPIHSSKMRPLRLFAFLPLLLPGAANGQQDLIGLRYDEQLDERCAISRNYEIKAGWVAELRARLPEIQSLWEASAPPMMAAVVRITGKPVDPRPELIRLTLCDSPSQSIFGVSVNMRFSLRSFSEQPVPLRYKIDTAFHEILHGFVSRQTPGNSPLLQRHEAESSCVRDHLHLLSLQKAVLLSLGLDAELEQVSKIDSQLPSGCYKRAWEIVNESGDTYRQYVQELAR